MEANLFLKVQYSFFCVSDVQSTWQQQLGGQKKQSMATVDCSSERLELGHTFICIALIS